MRPAKADWSSKWLTKLKSRVAVTPHRQPLLLKQPKPVAVVAVAVAAGMIALAVAVMATVVVVMTVAVPRMVAKS